MLQIDGITKTFGSLVANDHISFRVERGTVHALLGENGAGKSTLMNVLYGLYRPDAGRILLRDRPVTFHSPRDAIRAGIGMIHQHFMLVPPLSVAENIALGHDPLTRPWLNLRQVEREVHSLSAAYGLDVDPRAIVWQLPVGQQQRVEILKALYRKADLLILDEPTSVLTPAETEALFAIIRRLRDDGHTVIFISHKLDEVMAISDTVTVLRGGHVVETVARQDTTPAALARAMVGRDVTFRVAHERAGQGEPVLHVEGLAALNDRGLPALRGLSFVLHRGEILGVAGVDGNGQSELAECICGLRPPTAGRVRLGARDITGLSPRAIIEAGVGYIPADRQRTGLVLDFDIGENLILKRHDRAPFCRRGAIDVPAVERHAATLVERFDVRTASVRSRVRTLSGGNQQKVVLAREVSGDPAVLVAMQPTRGLDVGATEYVQRSLLAQRERGAAILYVSTELEEVLALSDRIAVLAQGELVGVVDAAIATREEVGMLMAGAAPAVTARWRLVVFRLIPVWALCLALGIGAVFISAAGGNPWSAYWAVFHGAFGDVFGFGATLTKVAPILLAGLGVALAARVGLFNIGAEGQIYLGGLGAAWVGLYVPGLPALLHIPLALAASCVAGGLWALLPAWLRVSRGVNEVITTLLMNYIAIQGVGYVVNGPMMEPGAPYPFSPTLLDSAHLPLILPEADAHAGIFLGLAAAVGLHWLLHRSALGYRIRAVGLNPTAAAYGGLSVRRTMLGAMFVSGALSGLAGAGEVMGLKYRLFDRFSPGYGFDAIAAAFLAGSEPLLVIATSLFFGALRSGGSLMQRAVGTPVAIVIVIQGLSIFLLTLGLVLHHWEPARRFLRGGGPRPAPAAAVERTNVELS